MDAIGEAEANLLRAKLQPFLSLNPEADFSTEGGEPSVSRLWGEEAIEVPLSSDDDELVEALNNLRLPPRFTAIWHEGTREFEVIVSVLPPEIYLFEREFEFHYRGESYHCSFGRSSPGLMAIAGRARTSGKLSDSGFRNLHPYQRFASLLKSNPDAAYVKNRRPTSFWIRGLKDYDDDRIGDLVRNLNFHMSYFDLRTPTILIHEDSMAFPKVHDVHRAHRESFPPAISGQDIDQHLLILWDSAQRGDPFLRFIHYYQILEYAGFYHIKDQVRREVERAIAAPDVMSRPEKAAQQILDAVSADRRPDTHKIDAMIVECVDPQEMWTVLEGSLKDFRKEVELDGGFVLPALVSATTSYEDFEQAWNERFANALHRVRNALVHARESRQSTMIAPTTANRSRIYPWLLPLSQTAARVMLYSKM